MWEEGRQDMWSLALVEEVGKQHSYTMKREGAASAGHMQFAGGKKALLWRLLLAVVMEQYQQYLESLKCVVLMEPFPCTPHSPVKPGTRSLFAQMSGPAELSSRVLVSLAYQKIISLPGAAKTPPFPHSILGTLPACQGLPSSGL